MYSYTASVNQLTKAISRLTKALNRPPVIGKIYRGVCTWVFEDDSEFQYVVWDNGKVTRETKTSWMDGTTEVLLDA